MGYKSPTLQRNFWNLIKLLSVSKLYSSGSKSTSLFKIQFELLIVVLRSLTLEQYNIEISSTVYSK